MVISSRLSNFSIDVTLLWPLFNMWKSTCNGIMRCNVIILQWDSASFVAGFLDGDAIHVLSSWLTHASNWNKTNTAMLTKHFLERLLGLVLFNGVKKFQIQVTFLWPVLSIVICWPWKYLTTLVRMPFTPQHRNHLVILSSLTYYTHQVPSHKGVKLFYM